LSFDSVPSSSSSISPAISDLWNKGNGFINWNELGYIVNPWDIKRLESYSRNLVDYHMILDLIPLLSRLFFLNRLPENGSPNTQNLLSISYTQQAILIAIGLQHKSVTQVEKELQLSSQQILALFNKATKKISNLFRSLEEKVVEQDIKSKSGNKGKDSIQLNKPLKETLTRELAVEGKGVREKLKQKQQNLLETLPLQQFAIGGGDEEWKKNGNKSGC